MIRYAITSGSSAAETDHAPTTLTLSAQAAAWARDRIDFVQLREKHLPDESLLALARNMSQILKSGAGESKPCIRLLINGRPDIAAAAHADGVHLTSGPGELNAAQVRRFFAAAQRPAPLISISCHNLEEVQRAAEAEVDLILFGPVFEKSVNGQRVHQGQGLEMLNRASLQAGHTPLLALGGVTQENIAACLAAGAAGIAAIRLFA